ncbi:MAG: aminotransferase class I/II-fold pyridoxal phosphate-dependent enzyme [Candidatus Spechtbacterales bacterium]
MRIFKPISISLSPNVQKDDVWLVVKILVRFLLHRARSGGYLGKLEQNFREYLPAKYALSFNSGRSALYTILRVFDMKENDEVLLQAFTCNAVPNPVLWAGGTPVYVDIDESLNIDPEDLQKKINNKSRAVIIQHTFGVPAQLDKILEIARRHNLIVIEDCAHALGALYNGKLVGTFGDIAFFSFGRDKVISSVWGGMITTNSEQWAQKIGDRDNDFPYPSRWWVLKQLLHPVLFSVIIPTYYIFGKYLLAFLRIVRGVGLAVSQKERMGERPNMFPARMPEALAELALHQLNKLEMYNAHRREIAELYCCKLKSPPKLDGAIYLRFNILRSNAREIIRAAKKKHILLGDWYKNVIDPVGTNFEKMKYTQGSCPNAERAARESINLPTHINISRNDARQVIKFLNEYSGNK